MDEIPVTSLFLLPTGLVLRSNCPRRVGFRSLERCFYPTFKCKVVRFDDSDANINNLSHKSGENQEKKAHI